MKRLTIARGYNIIAFGICLTIVAFSCLSFDRLFPDYTFVIHFVIMVAGLILGIKNKSRIFFNVEKQDDETDFDEISMRRIIKRFILLSIFLLIVILLFLSIDNNNQRAHEYFEVNRTHQRVSGWTQIEIELQVLSGIRWGRQNIFVELRTFDGQATGWYDSRDIFFSYRCIPFRSRQIGFRSFNFENRLAYLLYVYVEGVQLGEPITIYGR